MTAGTTTWRTATGEAQVSHLFSRSEHQERDGRSFRSSSIAFAPWQTLARSRRDVPQHLRRALQSPHCLRESTASGLTVELRGWSVHDEPVVALGQSSVWTGFQRYAIRVCREFAPDWSTFTERSIYPSGRVKVKNFPTYSDERYCNLVDNMSLRSSLTRIPIGLIIYCCSGPSGIRNARNMTSMFAFFSKFYENNSSLCVLCFTFSLDCYYSFDLTYAALKIPENPNHAYSHDWHCLREW